MQVRKHLLELIEKSERMEEEARDHATKKEEEVVTTFVFLHSCEEETVS